MCMIIYSESGDLPEKLETIIQENPDGYGFINLDTMRVQKGLHCEDGAAIVRNAAQFNIPYIVHFRWASIGKVNVDNCHPFRLHNGSYLMQNGTVKGYGNKDISDTRHIAETLKKFPRRLWRDFFAMSVSRFAVVDKGGSVELFGDWIEREGVLYSNDKPFIQSYKANWDFYDDVNYDDYDDEKTILEEDIWSCPYMAVYGTLKKGHGNHPLVEHCEFIGNAETLCNLCLNADGVPCLYEKPECGPAQVEVYHIPDIETLEDVDNLEGHPHWYERKKRVVRFEDGTTEIAWIYFQPGEGEGDKHVSSY